MANMSYCRFENTYNDLKDCERILMNYDSLDDVLNDDKISESEKKYISRLIHSCEKITLNFNRDE
jgi:hypothetical protein